MNQHHAFTALVDQFERQSVRVASVPRVGGGRIGAGKADGLLAWDFCHVDNSLRRGGEQDPVPSLAGPDRDPGREVGLACAGPRNTTLPFSAMKSSVPRWATRSRLRPRAWSKSNWRLLRAGNRAARMRPSPPWASRAATSLCRQAKRNSSCDQDCSLARAASRSPPTVNDGRAEYVAHDRPEVRLTADSSVLLTLVLDPRCMVHAISGVLPVVRSTLPTRFSSPALSKMAAIFRTGPMLSEPGLARMPLPALREGAWSWLQYTTTTQPATLAPVLESDAAATVPDAAAVLREGWLNLLLDGTVRSATHSAPGRRGVHRPRRA